MDKPDVDFIEGLSPAISIDQKSASRNPRSTVGTITEVYDYLRLLYARIGVPHCPDDGARLTRQTPQQIVDRLAELPDGTRFQVLAPVVRGRKGKYETLLADLADPGLRPGPDRRRDVDIAEFLKTDERLARYEQHTIEVIVDRLVRRDGIERRLTDSLETALRLADGVAEVELVPRDGEDARPRRSPSRQHLACPVCGSSRTRSWRPATSRSTRPTAPASTATASAPASRSTPSWSCPTPTSSVDEGAIAPWARPARQYFPRLLEAVAEANKIALDKPVVEAARRPSRSCCSTASRASVTVQVQEPLRPPARSTRPRYEGIIPFLQRRHSDAESDWAREQIEGYMREVPCPDVRRRPPQARHRWPSPSTSTTSPRSATCRSARRPSSSPASSCPSATT